MIYLFLASFFSLIIAIVFKLFERYNIDSNQAIVVNYIACAVTGCINLGAIPFEVEMIYAPWAPTIIFLGIWFMLGFNLVSLTVNHFGMAITTVAQRMSLGISATFSILYYNDAYTSYKILGILVAILAVGFINIPSKKKNLDRAPVEEEKPKSRWLVFYPITICLISAVIEIVLQYLHAVHQMLPEIESTVLFACAAFVGLLGLSVKVIFKGEKLKFRNLIAGVLLGVPNYFSIYFILKALDQLDGSTVYSINNILIVGSAAIVGVLIFKERLSKANMVGVGMAILSIFLLML
jgi:drug/metabolite transporter (DMT)-like permease